MPPKNKKPAPKVSAKAVADKIKQGKAEKIFRLKIFNQRNFNDFFKITAYQDEAKTDPGQPDPRNLETIDGGYDAVKD